MIAFSWSGAWYWLTWFDLVLAVVFSLIVLSSRKRSPTATIAWILGFFLLPFIGLWLYLLVGYRNLARRRRRKSAMLLRAGHEPVAAEHSSASELALRNTGCDKLASLAESLTGFGVAGANRVVPYEDPIAIYGALAQAIRSAKHHVHLESYIFEADERGAFFRDLLIEKAKEGVECRVLVDNFGSFNLSGRFLASVKGSGVKLAYFRPVRWTRPWGMQLRNHRKILVVDGTVGFIGSQNIGGEEIRTGDRKLGWRDTQVRIEGPAVHQLQTVFLEDWAFTTTEAPQGPVYFPAPPVTGTTLVQTLPTGPDENDFSLEMILLNLIPMATERIRIITPYFVPSSAVAMVLESAARRGVAVEFLAPEHSDHFIVHWASRTWFRDLARSGVRILQYGEAFLHAKVVTIDDKVSLIGSANMDMRSFRLNFECGLIVYDSAFTRSLCGSFDAMKAAARVLELEGISFFTRVRDGASRLLSPLL